MKKPSVNINLKEERSEFFSLKIRNKTSMPILATSVQNCNRGSSQGKQALQLNVSRLERKKHNYSQMIWSCTQKMLEEKLSGRIVGHGIYLSSQVHQEYIYKGNSSHRAPAEHQWKTLDTLKKKKNKENYPHNKVGQKKGRGIKRISNPNGKLKVRKSFHSEKSPHSGEISWDRKEIFMGLKENAADSLWKAGQSKNCVHGPRCRAANLKSTSCVSLVASEGWC